MGLLQEFYYICMKKQRKGDKMNNSKKTLAFFLAITLVVGLLAGYLIYDHVDFYDTLNKPAASPPKWLFPIVWNILYVIMSVAVNMVYSSGNAEIKRHALILYGIQLGLNFLWPILFFRFESLLLALYDIAALWVVLLVIVIYFAKYNKYASILFIPYLLWVSYASYLNFAVFLLN